MFGFWVDMELQMEVKGLCYSSVGCNPGPMDLEDMRDKQAEERRVQKGISEEG